ncbi:MAG: hypothetical protein ACPGVO_20455 [Spirulinaceae cyanobacterium]
MSESGTANITIPISPNLEQQLREVAGVQQKSVQELIIEAVELHLQQLTPSKSCYDVALDLGVIGVVNDLPNDLSTNPQYFEGFGEE